MSGKRKSEWDGIEEAPVTVAEDEIGIKFSKLQFSDDEQIRIYIVWTIGRYKNDVRLLDIRAVCTSLGKAKLYSKMLRRKITVGLLSLQLRNSRIPFG